MIGIAHHADSQTSNVALLASDVHSQPRAQALPIPTMLIPSPTTTAILNMEAILLTWDTTTMVITRGVEQAWCRSVLVTGAAAPKDANTITLQRTLIAFVAVHHVPVLLSWLTLLSLHPWALLQSLEWDLDLWEVLLDRLLMVPALLPLAQGPHLLSHPLSMECPLAWVPPEALFLKWVA